MNGLFLTAMLVASVSLSDEAAPNPIQACGLEETDLPWGVKAHPMESKLLGKEMCYLVILPRRGIKRNKTYPSAVLLHGLGGKPSDWLKSGFHQLIRRAMKTRKIPDMVTLIPAGGDGYWTNWVDGKHPYADLVIKEYLPHFRRRYRTFTTPQHTAIGGISMGAFGALALGMQHPKIFGSIIALSPTDMEIAIEDDPKGKMRVYRNVFGDPPDPKAVKRVNPRRLIDRGKGGTQTFYLVYGTAEARKFVEGTSWLAKRMAAKGVAAHVRTVEGGRHGWTTTWNDATQRWWLYRVAQQFRKRRPKSK